MKTILRCITLAVLGLLIFSCTNKSQDSKSESLKEKPALPNGWVHGTPAKHEAQDKNEQNLISQFYSYSNALYRGDIEGAQSYFLKDATIYYRKFYPAGTNDKQIENELFHEGSKVYVDLNQKAYKMNVSFENVVTSIERKVVTGNNIIVVFNYAALLHNEKASIYITPDESSLTIGISLNEGKNWKYLALTDDTPNILRLSFNDDVINQVMNY